MRSADAMQSGDDRAAVSSESLTATRGEPEFPDLGEHARFLADWLIVHMFVDVLLLAVGATWIVYRWCGSHDARQRFVLTALLVGMLVVASVQGLAVVRRDSTDDRQLRQIDRLLASVGPVDRLFLIAEDEPATLDRVPLAGQRAPTALALCCTMRSRWPRVPARTVSTWDEWAQSDLSGNTDLVVCWSVKLVPISCPAMTRAPTRTSGVALPHPVACGHRWDRQAGASRRSLVFPKRV
jgi:hypothetical protein